MIQQYTKTIKISYRHNTVIVIRNTVHSTVQCAIIVQGAIAMIYDNIYILCITYYSVCDMDFCVILLAIGTFEA